MIEGNRTLVSRALHKVMRPFWVLRDEGLREFSARALAKMHSKVVRHKPTMLVDLGDASRVDWTVRPAPLETPISVSDGPVEIGWIMSPPGDSSGGHQNLFRFIRFAELAGHRCTIYLYRSHDAPVSIPDIRAMVKSRSAYADVDADIVMYDSDGVRPGTQAIFATGWETAYPAYLDPSSARRFYFVQDFEPSFYPLGTEFLLAENTYRFGFHGITAGGWLSAKLRDEYGMSTNHFDFAVDKTHYSVTNTKPRDEIFFYARPVTARRAFEFGVLALREFARLKPDVTINLAGWDVSAWNLPFEYRNLTALDITQLNAVYNRCAAGLVLSLSNMSLLPLELMSAGVAPVVNDGPNNRLVSDNPFIEYVKPSPGALARRMVEIVERPDAVQRSIDMAASVETVNWEDSGAQFLAAFERAMRG
jgi:hypothetical protein